MRIPDYADYGDHDSRQRVDKQVRAWLGEALADARQRLKPTGALAQRLDGLTFRTEFADPRVIRLAEHARFDPNVIARIHALDRHVLDVADRIRTIENEDELTAALDEAARLLDERYGALAGAPSRSATL